MTRTNREESIKLLQDRISNGLKEVFNSGNFSDYLKVMSKFHTYSARNTLLILMANPTATLVTGYQAWIKNFSRYVKKGEKGIPIFAYTPCKCIEEKRYTDEFGSTVVKKEEREVASFKVVHVFDVSQTEGKPLPELVKELDGTVDNYSFLLNALQEIAPYEIEFRILPDAKGYCDPDEKRIIINMGMSEQQTIKTIIHEMVHAMKHVHSIDIFSEGRSRSIEEIEAECTAFVVCEHFGIDTSDYSFPYIAAWSKGKDLDDLLETCHSIQQLAEEIIEKIDLINSDLISEIRSSRCIV